MKKSIASIFLLLVSCLLASGQEIGGVVNSYYKITDLFATYVQADAGEDLSSLQPGDKVMLIQMSGIEVYNGPGFESSNQFYDDFATAGRYELLAVKSVNNISKQVEFTVTLDVGKFTSGEKYQLVKIYEADYANVISELTADPWNGDKGGVIALVIFKKLTLNSDINATGIGFRGGAVEPDYSAGCISSGNYYYPTGTANIAGRKGEGLIENGWTHTVGPGRVANGGGGGLGYYTGGGGGAHFGQGGSGGNQISSCPLLSSLASGGLALTEGNKFYGNDRVSMGGGGGSSTETPAESATPGGNGGGIVLILADTLEANNFSILNAGESVDVVAQAGGGGGGAGGSVLLDINVYTGTLNINVNGGNGGSTGTLETGAGGGGGGGVICFAGTSLSPAISYTHTRGLGGTPAVGTPFQNGGNGSTGGIVDSLQLPLHGFLFNSLVGKDTICQGQIPKQITASMPKGGQTGYTYTWLQSIDNTTWSAAIGTGDSLNFQPDALNQTTFFTRIVESGDVTDTALSIEVFVYDAISGNTLDVRDTLCAGDSPGVLSIAPVTGGDGNYSYLWESSVNGTVWNPRGTLPDLTEGSLTQSTYYRRTVTSADVCIDISNTDTISVIPVITGNTILSPDTSICEALDAGTILAADPSGGDGSYSFQWLQSPDGTSYTPIGGAGNPDYSPGVLNADRYFRRIVYSGEGNACADTSSAKYTRVYPSVSNNLITTDSSRYCEGDTPNDITGTLPSGGETGSYSYSWLMAADGSSWVPLVGEEEISYSPSSAYTDTTYLARVVISGEDQACVDTSISLRIDVIPAVSNTLQSPDEAICEATEPVPFTENSAGGGAGVYEYLWEYREEGADNWNPASELISPNDQPSYAAPALNTSTEFRRKVTSEICISNSNVVAVTVFPFIENNMISGGPVQYTCYNTPAALQGSEPSGGDPNTSTRVYLWQESTLMASWTEAAGTNDGRNYTSIPLTDSIYFRRIVTSGPDAQCSDTSAAVLIRINPLPAGDILSDTDSVCAGGEIAVQYGGLTGSPPWSISLGDDAVLHTEDGITENSGTVSFTLNASAGIVILSLSDDNGCEAETDLMTGMVDVSVFENPIANAGEDSEVCELSTLMNAVPSVGTGSWSGPGVNFVEPGNPASPAEADDYGTYDLTWTEVNWECESSDIVQMTFYQTPSDALAGEDQILDNFYETTLRATEPEIGNGTWSFVSGSGLIADSTQAVTDVILNGTGTYTLAWTVRNGSCEEKTDQLGIEIGELRSYTGFSPNGDGVNDDFILRFPGTNTVELLIYDQWGALIYSQTEENATELSWDGTYQGKIAAEGTYYYIVKDGDRTVQNYLELRR